MSKTEEYLNLKLRADQAMGLYMLSQTAMDWDYAIKCEEDAAAFAWKHEDEIDWELVGHEG